ncbi:hypothetical protein [Bacillus sp. T33-2]|uniref:hypothetical protein n=1 Tax=Bacillus sp. T33-2 TaxID=2054168 RepID=UPI002155C480|nr:hypothetical protein [Bacillus sp. T33-2]
MYVNEINLTPGGKITKDGVQSQAIANHGDPATATAAQIATKQNEILAALRKVGIIASS